MSRRNSSSIWYTSVNSANAQRPYWRRLLTPGDPVGVHGGFLFLGIFGTVALDLDDEVEEVIAATSVVDQDYEVW